jgi:hypothetical protein
VLLPEFSKERVGNYAEYCRAKPCVK